MKRSGFLSLNSFRGLVRHGRAARSRHVKAKIPFNPRAPERVNKPSRDRIDPSSASDAPRAAQSHDTIHLNTRTCIKST